MTDGPTDDLLRQLLLERELTTVLYDEAELLDEGRWEEWLDLLADDLTYVMPLRLNVAVGPGGATPTNQSTRPGAEVCWFDEGKATLAKRVAQLRTGVHWAEEPLSRVSHLVTNIRIGPLPSTTGGPPEVEVSCRFLIHRNRVAAETDFFVGRRHDTWRRTEAGWRLCRRELLLDQNVLLAKNLTVLF